MGPTSILGTVVVGGRLSSDGLKVLKFPGSRSGISTGMETSTSSPEETLRVTSGTGMVSFGLGVMGKGVGAWFKIAAYQPAD